MRLAPLFLLCGLTAASPFCSAQPDYLREARRATPAPADPAIARAIAGI